MADVKWIKITTDMFDNRKIKHLRRLPEGNSIVLIWVMLLTMAGRCNSSGMIFLTENIPYTPKMLADELNFEEATVQLALRALEGLNMIVANGDYFKIAGWEEYQNIEGMDKIREQNRLRKQRQRANQKLLSDNVCDGHVTVTECHATDKDKERDLEKESEGEGEEIISSPPPAPKPTRHKHGMYNNVLLSDEDMEKLRTEFPHDYTDRIERLSEYIASTGKSYKSHLATIRSWARKEAPTKTTPTDNSSFDADEFFGQAVKRANKRETSSNPFLEMLKNGEV